MDNLKQTPQRNENQTRSPAPKEPHRQRSRWDTIGHYVIPTLFINVPPLPTPLVLGTWKIRTGVRGDKKTEGEQMTDEDETGEKKQGNTQTNQLLGPRGNVEQRCVTKGHTGNAQKKGKWRAPRRGRTGTCQTETSYTYSTPGQERDETL